MNIYDFGRGQAHFEFELQKMGISELWCGFFCLIVALTIVWLIYMPRERVKPHRGIVWYAFDACRRRQQNFERALSMARTQLVHKARKPRMSPMAYVEEVISEESIQTPPEHLLFTVPDSWNPPTCFPRETTMHATREKHSSHRGDA